MFNRKAVSLVVAALVLVATVPAAPATQAEAAKAPVACDRAGLILPDGFCATVFADNLGLARHVVAAPDGTVYVNTWRTPYKKDAKIPAGGFLVALKDADGDGVAEKKERFGEDSATTASGGTGIAIHRGHLYAEASGKIVRYRLATGALVPAGAPEVILEGLILEGGHNMHPFAIAEDGTLFVNSGSETNACQVTDRTKHSPGKDPCPELATRAGLWRYHAAKTGQKFSPAERYASGVRNTVALAVHPTTGLWAVVHGRDQLHENWPEKFDTTHGSELPAEVMVKVKPKVDYGWPYCYYDGAKSAYVLAPEYGGDGVKTGRCADRPKPEAVFPAHWAPNALLFTGTSGLTPKYRGGAFIAFHGSWNRQTQQGYNVVFVPMDASGTPGKHEVFADGFAGATRTPQGAAHRPTGLALGPDGALYVSDDQGGRIYRIVARP